MTAHYDALETREHAAREAELFSRLPDVLRSAMAAPAYAERLRGVDPAVGDLQGGAGGPAGAAQVGTAGPAQGVPALRRLRGGGARARSPACSPRPARSSSRKAGRPIPGAAPGRCSRPDSGQGDVVLNTFSYHLTPGGFIFDSSARALGCAVIPAGPGNTEQQFELIEAYRPVGYSGTPDFLKILLDAAASAGRDVSSIKRALVSGAAFPPSLQAEIKARGIDAYQAFGTADLGLVAFETAARDGMVVNEDLIMEIVKPGTGDPVAPGDVGEIVVTSLDPHHPWIRLALGDLTAALPGPSPCGRTNMRIKGWMGRADQTTKVKGMFVRPEQIAEIGKRHPALGTTAPGRHAPGREPMR